MSERVQRVPTKFGGPRLKPEESTQRAAQIAVDMCVMNTQYMITMSNFLSDEEMFHLQMNLLYGLVDTMAAANNIDPESVLDFAHRYFKGMREERKSHAKNKLITDG